MSTAVRGKIALSALCALALATAAAFGQMHGDHGAHAPAAKGESKSTVAFRAANEKMHKGMDIAFTGNADVDFVNGMIAHHEGAVEMAKIVLTYGKDSEIRKLAGEIIKAQESEIAMMRAWLKRHAHH